MKHLAKISATIFLLSILGMFSCNQGGVKEQNDSDNESINQNENTSVTTPGDWLIVQEAGQEVGKIAKSTDVPRFFVQGTEYQSQLKGDKRKYAVKSGDIIAEVKYKEDAFKVRKPDGTLLWKIKLYDDKVKISNNEENLNPYELKHSDSGKIKLKKNEETLGKVELKDKQVELTAGPKSYYIETDKLSLAYGVLLIEEIPENLRYIIAVELLAKGK